MSITKSGLLKWFSQRVETFSIRLKQILDFQKVFYSTYSAKTQKPPTALTGMTIAKESYMKLLGSRFSTQFLLSNL